VSNHKRALPLRAISDVAGVATGDAFTCAVHGSGKVSCWGYGLAGELGHGKLEIRPRPALVVGIDDAVEVAAGKDFACARRNSGKVVCWGDNTYCQLGAGTGPFVLQPTRIQRLP
jgi:alpha-tubulin suppressor-like RCC1 family protein